MTNDTQFVERVANPEHKIPKTYLVKASTLVSDQQLDQLRKGVVLADGPTQPAVVKRIRDSAKYSFFEITIHEGRNRQVRRIVEAIGSKVLKLVRTGIGGLRIGELPMGKHRELTPAEVKMLSEVGVALPAGRGSVTGLGCDASSRAGGCAADAASAKAEPAAAEDGLELAESVETFLAVIMAHSARTDSAERQILGCDVEQRIVDAHAAGNGVSEHAIDGLPIAREQIEREGPLMLVYVMNGFVDSAVCF